MADTATPEAADSPKVSAEKDRSCPFCSTKFTSSSLGRHLDLYIKERNPKAPDGIHNVDEIRKLRGNVTRRQAKLSSSKREGSTPTSSRPASLRGQRSPSASTPSLPKAQNNGGSIKVNLNKPNWTNTGVINDLPLAKEDGANDQDKRRTSNRKVSMKEELNRKHVALDVRDRARAAELALRDILGNIKAAKYADWSPKLFATVDTDVSANSMRAHPQSPFDFNLFSLSFTAMCLRCLSAPPAMSFGSRISKERSWSIEPPSSYHLEALRRWLGAKLRDWRIRRRALGLGCPGGQRETNGHDSQQSHWSYSDPDADEHEEACTKHINASYHRWENLPMAQKQEQWHMECVNALTQEQDRHRDTRGRLEQLESQVHRLQAELNARNGDEQDSSNLPLSPQTALETFNLGQDSAMWDYDALIAKWRTRIQQERSQQHPLPATPWSVPTPVAQTPLYTNGNIRLTRPEQEAAVNHQPSHGSNSIDDDEDLVDAPCEEDDDSTAQMDQGLLDPKLRQRTNGSQDSVMENGSPQGKG